MKTKIFLLIVLVGLFSTCKKDEESDANSDTTKTYSISGKVQKGPFVTGTTININELNDNLSQTGKAFNTTIISDDGSYELSNVELASNYVLLTATGYYFNEIYGELSSSTLALQAIIDITDKQSINVNILTHVIKGRIENLVSNGQSYQSAYEQAKSEFLDFLGVTDPFDTNFEELDISQNNDQDAVLLAFSIITQRYSNNMSEIPTLTAELTQLLTNINTDFKTDGQINNQSIIDTILYNITKADVIEIRENIENKYADLGLTTTIPNFEKYIDIFQQKYTSNIVEDFVYPDKASPYIDYQNDTSAHVPNILNYNDSVFDLNRDYSFAAIVPFNNTLTVKYITNDGYSTVTGAIHGWELVNDINGFHLNSTLENSIITMPLGFDQPGSATIEFYENDSEQPTRVKNITWQ